MNFKKNKKIFVVRYKDEKAEPLFLCHKKEGFFSRLRKKKDQLFFKANDNYKCKYNKKVMLLFLPILTIVILTGGICASINNKFKISEFKNKPCIVENTEKYNKDILLYVNRPNIKNKKDFKNNIVEYKGVSCNSIIINDLERLILAAKREGLNINVVSGYINEEFRNKEYDRILNDMLAKGYTYILSEGEAKKKTFKYYEMETGLSIKFSNKSTYSDDFINTDEYKWLIKNSVDFGFILRAPKGKEEKTNIDFDSTLFRYVGTNNAKKMRMLSMCLEEYRSYVKVS